MSNTNHESETPPAQTTNGTAGSTSLSGRASRTGGYRGGTNNRGGNNNSYNRNRGEQSIIAINSTDRDYKGKVETIGVLGLPIERHLKFGLSFEDFQESLMQYTAANLKKGNDLKPLIKFLMDPIKRIGSAPDAVEGMRDDREKFETWKEKLSKYNRRIELIEDNMEKLYGIVMGQCTESLKSEIKGEDDYEDAEMDSNALWLMQTIKRISAGINTKKNEVQAYVNKIRDMVLLIQKADESLDAFQKRFRSAVQTLELAGGIEVFLPTLKTIGVLDYSPVEHIVDYDATVQSDTREE